MQYLGELLGRTVRIWTALVVGVLFGTWGLLTWLSSVKVALPWLIAAFLLTLVVAEAVAFVAVARLRDVARAEAKDRPQIVRHVHEPDRGRELIDQMTRDMANAHVRERRGAIADLMTRGQQIMRDAHTAAADENQTWEETANEFAGRLIAWEAEVTTWLTKKLSQPNAVQFTHAVESHALPDDVAIWYRANEALAKLDKRTKAGLDFLNNLLSEQKFKD
jgi:hypothetical protein